MSWYIHTWNHLGVCVYSANGVCLFTPYLSKELLYTHSIYLIPNHTYDSKGYYKGKDKESEIVRLAKQGSLGHVQEKVIWTSCSNKNNWERKSG